MPTAKKSSKVIDAQAEKMADKKIAEKKEAMRYQHGGIECIEAIKAALTEDEFRGFCKGNIIKYAFREEFKGGDADLVKACDYATYAVEYDRI